MLVEEDHGASTRPQGVADPCGKKKTEKSLNKQRRGTRGGGSFGRGAPMPQQPIFGSGPTGLGRGEAPYPSNLGPNRRTSGEERGSRLREANGISPYDWFPSTHESSPCHRIERWLDEAQQTRRLSRKEGSGGRLGNEQTDGPWANLATNAATLASAHRGTLSEHTAWRIPRRTPTPGGGILEDLPCDSSSELHGTYSHPRYATHIDRQENCDGEPVHSQRRDSRGTRQRLLSLRRTNTQTRGKLGPERSHPAAATTRHQVLPWPLYPARPIRPADLQERRESHSGNVQGRTTSCPSLPLRTQELPRLCFTATPDPLHQRAREHQLEVHTLRATYEPKPYLETSQRPPSLHMRHAPPSKPPHSTHTNRHR